jgi:DNA mismatch repair protein MutL
MSTIRQLPIDVVNKIAAGEVIERPASVVKELMENAVDAGAGRIDVVLEKGGSELIRIADDGCGISADELPLAVASHATSKIESADDLFSVTTMGFRGEALASIAAVSRLTIRSRPTDATSGYELEVVGGAAQEIAPAGCPQGTTIEVRNLFFNTPVRHKFLRSPQTEAGHSAEAFTRLALAHPNIHFTFSQGGRLVHDLPATDDLRTRVAAFFGEDLADGLIEIENSSDGITLRGHVANPMHDRSHNRMQYLFVNHRAIRDRALQHALAEAYRGLLLTGRYPICFLYLDMPPELVDVNVHPTKQEVRFQDSGRLYSQLLGTLRTRFLTTDLTARGGIGSPGAHATSEESSAASGASELVAWAKEKLGQQQTETSGSPPVMSRPAEGGLSLHRLDIPPFRPFEDRPHGDFGSRSIPSQPTSEPAGSTGDPQRALQVHNRYLVVETNVGIEVIDQHALHERILYEQLREKVLGGTLESQRLLVPEPVDLSATEAAAVLENAEMLARLGVDVQPFGGETVLISSYPAMLANLAPADVLRGLVEKLLSGAGQAEARDLLDELLHMIACKAAVKFGDRLAPQEVEALLEQRHWVQDSHHCPHGRPTSLVLTRDDLDRQFKRI